MNMSSIESRANDIFKRYSGSLPVNPEEIARALGCKVIPICPFDPVPPDEEGVSGCAYMENGVPIIKYSNFGPSVRRRFTIAHELGHHILGHTEEEGKKFRDTPENYQIGAKAQEREANLFAASLLMPAELIRTAVFSAKNLNINELAKAFDVSGLAMEIRLKHLGYVG